MNSNITFQFSTDSSLTFTCLVNYQQHTESSRTVNNINFLKTNITFYWLYERSFFELCLHVHNLFTAVRAHVTVDEWMCMIWLVWNKQHNFGNNPSIINILVSTNIQMMVYDCVLFYLILNILQLTLKSFSLPKIIQTI